MRNVLRLGVILLLSCSSLAYGQNNKIDSLLNILPTVEEGKAQIDLLNTLAFSYTAIAVKQSEKFVNEAIQKAEQIGYTSGLAESFKILGLVYHVRSEYSLAIEYSYKSLEMYEELQDKAGRAKVLNNLALILMAQKEYGRAYDFASQSIKLKREIGDSLGVANSILALAEFYHHAGDFPKALELCKSALTRFKSLHNDAGNAYALFTLGEIYLSQRKYPFASSYFRDAIHYAKLSNNQIQLINCHKQLGKLFLESQKYDSAYVYLRIALRLAREKDSRNNELEINEYLANHFTSIGQLDSALYYTRSAGAIEREIFNNQKQEQITSLQTLYDFQKTEQEINFQKKIVRRQYVAIIGVSIILLLSIIFGYRVYNLNRYNLQAKEALMKLNGEVNQINENLEVIVQQRTEEIKLQNQKLIEYAFFTAHEVRGPLARILGLIELAKIKDLSEEDKRQIMMRLENASNELDEVIRTINRKLESTRS